MPKYRKYLEEWAIAHYIDSFAVSAIVECWGDEEYSAYDDEPTAEAALKRIHEEYIGPLDESYKAARGPNDEECDPGWIDECAAEHWGGGS